jgi:hypothetical protein
MRTTRLIAGITALALTTCTSVADDVAGEPTCVEGGFSWHGQLAFRDASPAWKLDKIAPYAQRLSTADLDGDGWPDVFARRGWDTNAATDGARMAWVLHNDHGTFSDRTADSKILQTRLDPVARPAEISVFADVDNDGDLDVFTGVDTVGTSTAAPRADGSPRPVVFDRQTSEILLNDGKGHFSFAPESDIRHAESLTVRSSASFTDFDRDGLVDLWIGSGGVGTFEQDLLYRNKGGGQFADVTIASGLRTEDPVNVDDLNNARVHTQCWGVTTCDLDGDGTPELMSASYGRSPNHLWRGKRNGDGSVSFANESVVSGYAYDQRQDWHDNESARCWCKLHPGDLGCPGTPPPAIPCAQDSDAFRWNNAYDREPFRLGGNSGTTVCADFNNDGKLDLLTSEIVHWDVGLNSDPSEIAYNDGSARFTRPGNDKTGLVRVHDPGWNDGDIINAAFDFDNDGRMDVFIGSTDYPGTRAWLFHQKPDGTFERVPTELGIDYTSTQGVTIADFDRDGDLDLILGHSRFRCTGQPGDHCYPPDKAYSRFFENLVGQKGNWIQLDLEGGPGTNRAAIGARVTVKAGDLVQVQEVDGGHGMHGVQNDPVLHFGLGTACEAEVTVRWPDAALHTQNFTVPARQRYHVLQGKAPTPEVP